jgi:hypothetical protein
MSMFTRISTHLFVCVYAFVCIQVLEEQALRMITWSGSLNNDYLNEQQHRMNQGTEQLTVKYLCNHVMPCTVHNTV